MIYLTGDTHGNFDRMFALKCRLDFDPKSDAAIVLGDACVNYYLDNRDRKLKEKIAKLGFHVFCIQGNHEERPYNIDGYKEVEWRGGIAYREDGYPNLLFSKDGEIYDLDGYKAIAIGGACSIDKSKRLAEGLPWFPDEQPSDEIKGNIEAKLDLIGWRIDIVLSHTCPFSLMPQEALVKNAVWGDVDNSTEIWLDKIERKLDYKKWYCGHFHCEKDIDKLTVLYGNIACLDKEDI